MTTEQTTPTQFITNMLDELFQLTEHNSVVLYLNDCHLTTLPSTIGNFVHAESLHLENNELTTLPPEIGNLTNLKKLYLGGNPLKQIPREMKKLIHLEELYLDTQQLMTLPTEDDSIIHPSVCVYKDIKTKTSEFNNPNHIC